MRNHMWEAASYAERKRLGVYQAWLAWCDKHGRVWVFPTGPVVYDLEQALDICHVYLEHVYLSSAISGMCGVTRFEPDGRCECVVTMRCWRRWC